MTTNEAALKLARQIAANDARNSYPMFGADILAGRCDDAPRVRCVLAAILEVTERAAGLAEKFGETPAAHGPALVTRRAVATALREMEHLS